MRTALLLLSICMIAPAIAQRTEDDCVFKASDTVYLPHYGQNAVLDSVLHITMGREEVMKSSSVTSIDDGVPFHIPVKIWLYHNDGGIGDNDALSVADAERLFNEVNRHFANNNTGIQFYKKCEIEHISSSRFNNVHKDDFTEMLRENYDAAALNLYLVRDLIGADGTSKFPWESYHFSSAIQYGGNGLDEQEISTTVHEIGHALGLLHTHENIRNPLGQYNGDAGKCYQESVSRHRTQGLACISTVGQLKCEINGDAICDTKAASNMASDKTMTTIACEYTDGRFDQWGDAWDPPVRNFMSYVDDRTCRSQFTTGQIGAMHSYISLYMAEGAWPIQGIIGEPWYNLNSIALSGAVSIGENEHFTVPQVVEVARGGSYTVKSGGSVAVFAGEHIDLNPGLVVEKGASFTAETGDVTDCSSVLDDGSVLKSSSTIHHLTSLSNAKFEKCTSLLLRALNNRFQINFDDKEKKATDEINDKRSFNVYPAPVVDVVNFRFQVKDECRVMIVISSVNGSYTETINDGLYQKGDHVFSTGMKHLPKGIYLYQLIVGNDLFSGKLVNL